MNHDGVADERIRVRANQRQHLKRLKRRKGESYADVLAREFGVGEDSPTE